MAAFHLNFEKQGSILGTENEPTWGDAAEKQEVGVDMGSQEPLMETSLQ